ncbi:hypothetical protein B484DRAFT_460060, partial [Ochromonadaceae sp. CCMP2298]
VRTGKNETGKSERMFVTVDKNRVRALLEEGIRGNRVRGGRGGRGGGGRGWKKGAGVVGASTQRDQYGKERDFYLTSRVANFEGPSLQGTSLSSKGSRSMIRSMSMNKGWNISSASTELTDENVGPGSPAGSPGTGTGTRPGTNGTFMSALTGASDDNGDYGGDFEEPSQPPEEAYDEDFST